MNVVSGSGGCHDISIMLGMGDQHGEAAIAWTVDNLGTDYTVGRASGRRVVSSFRDGKTTDFGSDLGRRRAYRFNFSDQHALIRTLDVNSVTTRLCFDSAAVTLLLGGLRAVGIFRLLTFKFIRNAIIALFGKMRFGSDRYALKIDAWGRKDEKEVHVGCYLQGAIEADITAKVAVYVADLVYRSSLPQGVFHLNQLIEAEQVGSFLPESARFELKIK